MKKPNLRHRHFTLEAFPSKSEGPNTGMARMFVVMLVIHVVIIGGMIVFDFMNDGGGETNSVDLGALIESALTSKWGILVVATSVAALVSWLLKYLGPGETSESRVEQLEMMFHDLARSIQKKNESFEPAISEDSKREIVRKVEQRLSDQTTQSLLASLEEKFSKSIIDRQKCEEVAEIFSACRQRLLSEAAVLSRRGNINLVVGVVLSTAALSVLFSMGTAVVPENPKDWSFVLAHYLPKLALAVFVQIFAFFFLKMYRMTLMEQKYFHNEVTNIEMIDAAVDEGRRIKDDVLQADLARALVEIDRNKMSAHRASDSFESDQVSPAQALVLIKELLNKSK